MSGSHPVTRRHALARAIGVGGLVVGGSAAPQLVDPSRSWGAAPVETDGQLVYATMAVELLVIAIYERVIASGKLSAAHGVLADRMLSYERVHARVLGSELRTLGVAEPPSLGHASSSSLDAILVSKQVPESVAQISNESEALALLIKIEEVAEGAYYHAIARLTDSRLALRSAQIMAAEAQHRTILSEARNPGHIDFAVPVAFVQGRG
ncbi:MAG TPA: ferritin-like domain-containing protein [Solirubrobacteraceae bacterium]|nr:ferritin-like domain-containing protein [Solirubrobacteraceae bacterium]